MALLWLISNLREGLFTLVFIQRDGALVYPTGVRVPPARSRVSLHGVLLAHLESGSFLARLLLKFLFTEVATGIA